MRQLACQLLPTLMVVLIAATAGCRATLPHVPFGHTEGDAHSLCQQGAAALERGDLLQAEKHLANAIRIEAADSQSRCLYAEVLRREGRLQEAVEQLRQAAKASPNDAGVYIKTAAVQLDLRQLDAAQASIEQAIGLDTKRADAWLVHGRIMRAKGDLQQALASLHRGLSFAPEDRAIRYELAEVYQQMRQPHRALAVLDALAADYPPGEEPQRLFHLKGLVYMALGRYTQAADALAAACSRQHPSQELLGLLAQAQELAARTVSGNLGDRQRLALNPRPAEDSLPPPTGPRSTSSSAPY